MLSFYWKYERELIKINLLINVVAAKTSYLMLKSFIILRSGEGLTSSNKDNNANFSAEKSATKHSGMSTRKKTKIKSRTRSCSRPRI